MNNGIFTVALVNDDIRFVLLLLLYFDLDLDLGYTIDTLLLYGGLTDILVADLGYL